MAFLTDEEQEVVDEQREPVPLVLPLDRATLSWLTMLSGGDDEMAAEIVASMVAMIRIDDEAAHRQLN
jgi:hypothetical protein